MSSLLALGLVVAGMLAGASTDAQAQFGIASLTGSFATTQAGAHTDFSTSLALSTDALGNPEGQLKAASFALPVGTAGNAQAIERCTVAMLQQSDCARTAQVGELSLTVVRCAGSSSPLLAPTEIGARQLEVSNADAFCTEQGSDRITIGTGSTAETVTIASIVNATTLDLAVPMENAHQAGDDVTHLANLDSEAFPLYNIQPSTGHVATFAGVLAAPFAEVFIEASVGADGRLTASITETSTLLQIVSSTVTLWGVPAAASHDAQRCNELRECGPSDDEPAAFMTNPTSCSEFPEEEATATSWQGESATSVAKLPAPTGCEQLSMSPSLAVAPSTTRQDSPAGYAVTLHVPQNESPDELATPALERVSITLPSGTSLSPGLANGLLACEPAQFSANRCPDASRIGTAEIVTPLLPEPLKGALYIGTPTPTERYRVLLRASDANTVIALGGEVAANKETGQVSTVFHDLPQLPFATLRLSFFGGATAALANPGECGAAISDASTTSYAGQSAHLSSTFDVDEAAQGGACQAALAFTPSFTAGMTDALAGHASSFILAVSRTDGQQSLSSFTVHLPPGLVGLVGKVPPCRAPAAGEGACPGASEVGKATVTAGAGPLPLVVSGPVYLTGPYDGAPLGLDIVIKVIAGPFDLGTAVVRSRVFVDPSSTALMIASDALPQILSGIPLRVRALDVNLDRAGFLINPTSCAAQAIGATIDSSQGASAYVAAPFQAVGCRGLTFAPHLTASTQAKAGEQGDGAGLDIGITNPAGPGASLRSVVLHMPSQLRPRLTTIQHACVAAKPLISLTMCAAESQVGEARIVTPMTESPLAGPIYLVSRGGGALPSLLVLLQSEGIEADLEGTLKISPNDAITTAFMGLPDVPISSLMLTLPRGPHSILGAVTNLCAKPLTLASVLVDQSGARRKATARIAVNGCPRRPGHTKRARRARHH